MLVGWFVVKEQLVLRNSFLKLSTLKAQRDVWVIISKTQIPKKTKDQHQPTTH